MFKVQGKVTVKETGQGIPDLVVHVFDIDRQQPAIQTYLAALTTNRPANPELGMDRQLPFDSLGSVFTMQDGGFLLEFDQEAFNVGANQELRPELFLIVTRPEDDDEGVTQLQQRMLYASQPIRFKAGRVESYHIRVRQAILEQHALWLPRQDGPPEGRGAGEKVFQHVKGRAMAGKTIAQGMTRLKEQWRQKVDTDFAAFTLSTFNPALMSTDHYWRKGENLGAKRHRLIDRKLRALAEAGSRKKMVLRFSQQELVDLGFWRGGAPAPGNLAADRIEDLFARNTLQRRAINACRTEFSESDLDADGDAGDTLPADESDRAADAGPTDIVSEVGKQVRTATSPETALRYQAIIDGEKKEAEVCDTIGKLSLCGGPADITSYHDFHSIQIAFEHVWTEVFDQDLLTDGKRLYTEVVKRQEGYEETATREVPVVEQQYNDFMGFRFPAGFTTRIETRAVSSVNDLKDLIREFEPQIEENAYIRDLVDQLQERLASAYKFDVFAPNSVNYGVVFTFRQKWEPANYQAGRLISSLPLAPKEVRRYSTKRVVTKSKNEKFLDDREFSGRNESTSTSRAETEIVKRATNTTSFGMNTRASVNMEMFEAGVDTNMSNQSEKFSQDTKKNFREAVLNAVEEYRRQNKTEVEIGWRDELTTENSGEISNPNDEITVTYLFYELQRQYFISEELHKVQPVIMVANEVPAPNQIDHDWLMAHAWILKRVILDESFLPALNHLTASTLGDNLAIGNLKNALRKQQQMVNALIEQIESKNQLVNHLFTVLQGITIGEQTMDTAMEVANMARSFVDPIGSLLGGIGGGGDGPSFDKVKDMLQMAIERAEKETNALSSQLNKEKSYLQQLTEKYNKELQDYMDRQTAITQLRMHVKDNILYYMQAIWDYEPVDQRYFRLYNLLVDWFEPIGAAPAVEIRPRPRGFGLGDFYEYEATLPPLIQRYRRQKRRLVEIADLDRLLGYKGNYMIFPVKDISYLHQYMLQEFIDNATDGVRDADAFANENTQALIDYLKCLRTRSPEAYARERDEMLARINERLNSTRKERERVIVPTDSLFIEALPGKHPIMEDFKLAHRALDVKKVQADVRQAELENLRLAARLLANEYDDPNIDKQVVVRGDSGTVSVDV